jgi:hypothetical protein
MANCKRGSRDIQPSIIRTKWEGLPTVEDSGFPCYYQPPDPIDDDEELPIIPIEFKERKEPNLGTETYSNFEDCQQKRKIKRLFGEDPKVRALVFWTWRKKGNLDVPVVVAIMDVNKRRKRNGSIVVGGKVQILTRQEAIQINHNLWSESVMPEKHELDGKKHRMNSSAYGIKIGAVQMRKIRDEFAKRGKITPALKGTNHLSACLCPSPYG